MTRSLQATLPAGNLGKAQAPRPSLGATVLRELQGWLAARRESPVPANAKLSLRAQRLMRSW